MPYIEEEYRQVGDELLNQCHLSFDPILVNNLKRRRKNCIVEHQSALCGRNIERRLIYRFGEVELPQEHPVIVFLQRTLDGCEQKGETKNAIHNIRPNEASKIRLSIMQNFLVGNRETARVSFSILVMSEKIDQKKSFPVLPNGMFLFELTAVCHWQEAGNWFDYDKLTYITGSPISESGW